jgi:hypothetical protein
MPETIDAQFSELTRYARDNARLAQAAELRAPEVRGGNRHGRDPLGRRAAVHRLDRAATGD